MRKNRMMRAASALLVAVLLTTSTISGTFAKYVTTASGTDSARVAKWGIEATIDGSLFEKSYKDAPTETENEITVKTSDSSDVVAPGTKNEEGITFILRGTPEVDYEVKFVIKNANGGENAVDVVLPAGTYTDYTKATGIEDGKLTYDTFTLAADYHPLVFTLKTSNSSFTGTLKQIEEYLENATKADGEYKKYNVGTSAEAILGGNGTYTLTWEWVFDGNDKADTYLGNVAAGLATLPEGGSISTDIVIELVVTQVN